MLPPSYEVKPDKNSILVAVIDYMKQLRLKFAEWSTSDALANPHIEYRHAFLLAKQGIAFAGIDSRFWDVNDSLCSTVGFSSSELLAMTFMNLTLQDDLEMFLGNARRLLCGEATCLSFTCRWLRRDQRVIVCLIDMNVVRRGDTPFCFVLYVRQI